jgi:potassium/hydrogen antiporter
VVLSQHRKATDLQLTTENFLLVGSLLLFISIVAGKTSYKFGVPTLVLFLAIGMLAGSDGLGDIRFDDPMAAQFIGIVALNFILFSGGLDTNWSFIRPILWQGLALSTVGVLLTAVSLGVFVWAITDFTIYESLLLGSIVSSTDAAAVFSILRSKALALKRGLRPTLELESGSNDPMAYVLTIAFLSLVMSPEKGLMSVIPLFVTQMLVGGVAGIGFGKLSELVINRIRLGFEGLYPVLVIALMFITFSATDFVGGNGFLAVYICAVFLGNRDLIHKKTILKMFDGMAWLMQIGLFVTLGLLVFPSKVVPIMGLGLLISLFLIVVARPLSVFVSLAPFTMRTSKKVYISWVGLRGAVPIVFATYPLLAGIEKAETIFNLVFFIALTSVLVQGTTIGLVAKWLKVAMPENLKPNTPVEQFLGERAWKAMRELPIGTDSRLTGLKLIDLHLTDLAVVVMIKRGDRYLTPSGGTVIEADDLLYLLSENEERMRQVHDRLMARLGEGPVDAGKDV